MFSLVYCSKAKPDTDASVIRSILETARNFNSKNDISGCLLYYQGEFIQYLEGKQIEILQLYDRIKADPRHREVTLLSHGEIQAREFGDWSMAFEDFTGDNDQLQFLRLLIESFVEDPVKSMEPNPSSKYFWRTAKRLLTNHKPKRYS